MMDRKKAIEKIRKCLALGESSEPAEAAAAIRQAHKLMEIHGISDSDVEFSTIVEARISAGRSTQTPPMWLSRLAAIVDSAFGVAHFYESGYHQTSVYVFIGVDPKQEIASYAFTVLRRQLTAARQEYYKSIRGKRANRIRRADVYAGAWCQMVERKVREFAKTPPAAIGNYLAERHSGLVPFKQTQKTKAIDLKDALAGAMDGSNVQLHHGVGDQELRRLSV